MCRPASVSVSICDHNTAPSSFIGLFRKAVGERGFSGDRRTPMLLPGMYPENTVPFVEGAQGLS